MRIHLDTDLGGDPDDLCALALLLGWRGVELVGITTSPDADGRRAGYARRLLELAGRDAVPVAAGAAWSLTTLRPVGGLPDEDRYWGEPVTPVRSSPGAALDLLAANIAAGATVVAVGGFTNLALLEIVRPGSLAGANVVVMGGWVEPPLAGLPPWGPERDWNVQCDTTAAEIVASAAGTLTLATLPATMQAQLRRRDLPRVRAAGPVGELIARQSELHALDAGKAELSSYPGVADDFLNFHYDPVACAVAVGWDGADVDDMRLRVDVGADGVLRWVADDETGRAVRVLRGLDADEFTRRWLDAVEAAHRDGPASR